MKNNNKNKLINFINDQTEHYVSALFLTGILISHNLTIKVAFKALTIF